MKIKHLLLIPILGYLIYLYHHAFTVSFRLTKDDIETPFDIFAGTITAVTGITFFVLSPFIITWINENTRVIKRINKFLNHKIL